MIKDGWHGDTSRMYFVGTPSVMPGAAAGRGHREAMFRGIRIGPPGATLGDIGHAIQSYAEAERFSVVREYCGHGIGKVYHDDPQVPALRPAPGEGRLLKEGMTFTIEPMINRRATPRVAGRLDGGDRDRKLSAQWSTLSR